MILRSIQLENFGLFAGIQTVDLVPRRTSDRETPVVLIGGSNGSGKTTLLEAVRLALYGRRALGQRVGQTEYDAHLRRRMHVGRSTTASAATSVGLEFDYAEGGILQRYRVVRRWTSRGNKVAETLTLERDGEPVASVPRDEWHNFLQELIPPGVSQLFFFDGEKIAEIASDDPDTGLAEAVRGLLGIELVGRLRTDLGLFLARRGRADDDGTAARIQEIEAERRALNARIEALAETVAELASRRVGQTRHAAGVRQRFVAEGGGAANRRASLEAERDELLQQIKRREAEVRDLAGGLLPFAAAPKLMGRFADALGRSEAARRGADAAAIAARIVAWRAAGDPPRTAKWLEGHWRDLTSFLSAVGTEATSDAAIGGIEPGERRVLLARTVEVRETADRARSIGLDLASLGNRLREVEADIVRASGHAAGVILDELLLAEQRVGAVEAEARAREEELKGARYELSVLDREARRLQTAMEDAAAAEGRAALAGRVGKVLRQYEERLLDAKLAQLQAEFVGRFNRLANKEGFVADVRIDRTTFEATLIDPEGREIRKAGLSAGEKQVYAIAMLWALARTSGRELPMIIDTPLARLDSGHRAGLVEKYFPEASHQVIVLSTDTEIERGLLERLMPAVSHCYRLDFDPVSGGTVARRGYFGDEEARHAVRQT